MPDSTPLAQAADVVMCYRLFLGREPEGDQTIAHHLRNRPMLWDLISAFVTSHEYELKGIDRGCGAIWNRQDGRGVCMEASPEARQQILDHIGQIWTRYGTADPYFSVLTNPAYRQGIITEDLTEHFYESGSIDVSNFNRVFQRNQIGIDPRWRILELGCGVGRIAEHLSRQFLHYIGVDISREHLDHAKRRLTQKEVRNADLYLLQDAIAACLPFDIFYSIIVLQHNPPPIIYHLLNIFLDRLATGGFALFQLPCHLYDYTFDLDRYLSGEGKLDGMEMHALPQKYVFELLHAHGLRPIEVCPFPIIGPIGISYLFFAQKSS